MFSLAEVGIFLETMGKSFINGLKTDSWNFSIKQEKHNISTIVNAIVDEYNKRNSTPVDVKKIEDDNTEKFGSGGLFLLHFPWFIFLVIIFFSMFTTDKTKAGDLEVIMVIVMLVMGFILYFPFNSWFENKTYISVNRFPKILTFLIFYCINSLIATIVMSIPFPDEKKEEKKGLQPLKNKAKDWRYGTPAGIVLASILSLGTGWILFILMPKMVSSDDKPVESNQTTSG